MRSVSLTTAAGEIRGHCDASFRGVLDAFAENFEARGEVVASVAVTREGRPVVDIWGGRRSVGGEPTRSASCLPAPRAPRRFGRRRLLRPRLPQQRQRLVGDVRPYCTPA